MIIVTGTVVVAEPDRAAFTEVARRQVMSSRAEEGCISYDCGEDPFASGRFVFTEKWRDGDALQTHFAKAYSIAFVKEARALAVNAPVIEIHEVAQARTVTPR